MWNLENDENKGMRFSGTDISGLDENEWIEIRLLSQADTNEIDAMTRVEVTQIWKDPANPLALPVPVTYWTWKGATDDERNKSRMLADEMRFVKSFVNWCLYKTEKTQIPFTRENVLKLRENPRFVKAWGEAIAKLVETFQGAEKN